MIRLAIVGDERLVSSATRLGPWLSNADVAVATNLQQASDTGFDAVVLSVDNPLENVRTAASQGKHVLLASNPNTHADATTLAQENRDQSIQLMPGLIDRFQPSMQTVKQSLDAGQLGDPGLIRIHRWDSNADPTADIDLAIWMFQKLPTEVYAVERQPTGTGHRFVQLHLGFPNGGMGLIDVSNTPTSTNGYYSLSLIGSSGAAYADDHHNQQLLFRGDKMVALKTGEGDAAQLALLQEFVDCITEERAPSVTIADLQSALLVREAAKRSIESGRTARLSGDQYEC